MFIIIYLGTWNQYEVIKDWKNQIKLFSSESECIDYCETLKIYPYQFVEISI
jgi:hypothetical protein